MKHQLIAMGLGVAAIAGAAAADEVPDILKRAINQPSINYSVYGPNQTTKMVRDDKVVGGRALRVDVTVKGAETYSVGASAALVKPIVKGHRITVAVWLRAPRLKDGETTPIPYFGVNQSAAPFSEIVHGQADITNGWALYQGKGIAAADYPVGTANATVHLSAAKAAIDLGPVFVLDMGPAA